MRIILLSGGAGKRLWPLSNSVRSKQFLKLLPSPGGNNESMIQRVVRQIKDAGLSREIVVSTGGSQKELILDQLGNDFPIVVEPARRDTFPAIYLACLYLKHQGVSENEVVIVMPCDSFAGDEYFSFLKRIEGAVKNDEAEIMLVGIAPSYPSSKYGYILPDRCGNHAFDIQYIKKFVEKPDTSEAERLIRSGALWNAGVYGFKLGYLLNLGEEVFKLTDYKEMLDRYASLPKLSFSYEVLEKSCQKAVVRYEGKWEDIGTWNSLTAEMKNMEMGDVLAQGCRDTYIINELGIPLLSIGCDNMIIAASPEGILVADRDKTESIGVPNDIEPSGLIIPAGYHGDVRMLGKISDEEGGVSTINLYAIPAGGALEYEVSRSRDELWVCLDGRGRLTIDGNITEIQRDTIIRIPKGCIYGMRAISAMKIIVVSKI